MILETWTDTCATMLARWFEENIANGGSEGHATEIKGEKDAGPGLIVSIYT
jgi:hypothetical protein